MNSCLSCKKYTKNINPKIVRTKNNRLIMLSKCSVCNNKKYIVKCIILIYKMNNTINKFLLAGDKFMPEMHLQQPGFTYSA